MSSYSTKIVSGILFQDKKLFLCLRNKTRLFPGYWSVPVGHIQSNENEIDALRRELFEEIGIQVIDVQSITKLFDNEENVEHSVFKVIEWRGSIENKEPELCAKMGWFNLNELPTPLTPATQMIIESLSCFEPF